MRRDFLLLIRVKNWCIVSMRYHTSLLPDKYLNERNNTMMDLKKFRVTNFRSVEDSGWIETDDVTALIGTNESGKTNIILPLWKLNPAKEGAIIPTADYPRKRY